MFSRSQLPLPDLAKIWSLADYGKDHRLDKDEFIIAMYFINARLKVPPVFSCAIVRVRVRVRVPLVVDRVVSFRVVRRDVDCPTCCRITWRPTGR
jgi:hypothetical protein